MSMSEVQTLLYGRREVGAQACTLEVEGNAGCRVCRHARALARAGLFLATVLTCTFFLGPRQSMFLRASDRVPSSSSSLFTIKCSAGIEDCTSTGCCTEAGTQCYRQNGSFAQCRPSCTPGPDPTHSDGAPWSCVEVGLRTPGDFLCGGAGDSCQESHCCKVPGMQCYAKNDTWAVCKADCAPRAPDPFDADGAPWTCDVLGMRAPGTAAWIQDQCSSGWHNCISSRCCKTPGQQCYSQNQWYGTCMAVGSCVDGGWACDPVGSPTPTAPGKGGKLAPWAVEECSRPEDDCSASKCCLGMDLQCYATEPGYAQCLPSCVAGTPAANGNGTWSCKELGLRSYGLAIKGSPSLFCFSVIRLSSYELELIKAQRSRSAGIFACDGYSVLTADGPIVIDGVEAIQFPGAPIVTSVDGTAGNTQLFVNAWGALIPKGQWEMHAFTVKVDPDAVFFPDHLRPHLAPYVGEKVFVINCHVGDMIFGALEIFSFAAIQEWVSRGSTCAAPNNYGEDKYMTTCMDTLGVTRVHDEGVLGDKLCGTFTTCSNSRTAAFHPFKDIGSWVACWNEGSRGY